MMISLTSIQQAVERLRGVVAPTPLQYSERLSDLYGAQVYLKREDLTRVRSFKIRGAYNKIAKLVDEQSPKGGSASGGQAPSGKLQDLTVVCASAGNHAQGVAYACKKLKVKGIIYMPLTTPNQKVQKVRYFGGAHVVIKLVGHTFDEAKAEAQKYSDETGAVVVHPFDDDDVIAGQGTTALEIAEQLGQQSQKSKVKSQKLDYLFVPIGGGGLISGVSSYFKVTSPATKVIGVEPEYADSMRAAIAAGKPVTLERFDTFVDGAAVRTTGEKTLAIVRECVDDIVVCPVGLVCTTMIELYQSEGIVTEPAGALSVAALTLSKDLIRGKTIICIISGGNNDLLRYPEILEKSLISKGLKHYFIIEFAQKPGQLKSFLNHALSPTDDIVLFEYMKKSNKEKGPALVGIELQRAQDLSRLTEKMTDIDLTWRKLDEQDMLYRYLI